MGGRASDAMSAAARSRTGCWASAPASTARPASINRSGRTQVKKMPTAKSPPSLAIVIFASCFPLLLAAAALAQETPAAAPASEIDWPGLYAEAGQYFRGYLRYDTSNPPGDVES